MTKEELLEWNRYVDIYPDLSRFFQGEKWSQKLNRFVLISWFDVLWNDYKELKSHE